MIVKLPLYSAGDAPSTVTMSSICNPWLPSVLIVIYPLGASYVIDVTGTDADSDTRY